MSEDKVQPTPRVEVVPGSAKPLTIHEEAIIDAGRQMFAESGQVSRDFAKQMITAASAAIPVYLGLLGAAGLSHRSRTTVLLVALPSLAFLLSVLLFVLALMPRRELVSLQNLDQLSDAREKFLRTRYQWIQIGLTVFGSAVIGAIASVLTLMSTSR